MGATMSNLSFFLLCITIAIYAAAEFRGQGWADQVCANTFGLCDKPLWLGVAAMAFFLGAFFMRRRA